jgi:hypothetical protein
MAAVMIGQSGLQLQSIRTNRLHLQDQQEHLNRATREIVRQAEDAHREIQAALDETSRSRGVLALFTSLAQAALQPTHSTDDPSAMQALCRLDGEAVQMVAIEKR